MKATNTLSALLIAIIMLSGREETSAQITKSSFEEVFVSHKKDKPLLMVLIGTEWCKYCKAMEQMIFGDKSVGRSLSKPVYALYLNAEDKRDIQFADRRFKYKPTGINTGVHELAEALGTINGQIAYPSLCFLNEKNEIIYQHEGYLPAPALIALLNRLTKL